MGTKPNDPSEIGKHSDLNLELKSTKRLRPILPHRREPIIEQMNLNKLLI